MKPGQPAASRRWRATPRGKYAEHKRKARQRGVGFLLTFKTWWALWEESGCWDLRGNRQGAYVMARHNDVGPYAEGNVSIQAFSQNVITRNQIYHA